MGVSEPIWWLTQDTIHKYHKTSWDFMYFIWWRLRSVPLQRNIWDLEARGQQYGIDCELGPPNSIRVATFRSSARASVNNKTCVYVVIVAGIVNVKGGEGGGWKKTKNRNGKRKRSHLGTTQRFE
jgi:hypothetical protein